MRRAVSITTHINHMLVLFDDGSIDVFKLDHGGMYRHLYTIKPLAE